MAAIAVNVQILGKEYRVACQDHEREELLASARLLDEKMREVKATGKVVGTERLAIMAALNVSHELLQYKLADRERSRALRTRMQGLQQKIEVALDDRQQVSA
jgi:cell division protein ZapA